LIDFLLGWLEVFGVEVGKEVVDFHLTLIHLGKFGLRSEHVYPKILVSSFPVADSLNVSTDEVGSGRFHAGRFKE